MSKISSAGRPAALVALKAGPPAKSRLAALGDSLRRELAWSMAVDTLTALRAAVDVVLVVGSGRAADIQRLGLDLIVLPDPAETGLNPALRHGAASLRDRGADCVLACVGDLPALTPASVSAVVKASVPYERSFLADASGIGTTMLVARGVDLNPRFGGPSAAAHAASGAQPLAPADLPVPDARTDVDTEVDLVAAQDLGVGRATAEVLRRAQAVRRGDPPAP